MAKSKPTYDSKYTVYGLERRHFEQAVESKVLTIRKETKAQKGEPKLKKAIANFKKEYALRINKDGFGTADGRTNSTKRYAKNKKIIVPWECLSKALRKSENSADSDNATESDNLTSSSEYPADSGVDTEYDNQTSSENSADSDDDTEYDNQTSSENSADSDDDTEYETSVDVMKLAENLKKDYKKNKILLFKKLEIVVKEGDAEDLTEKVDSKTFEILNSMVNADKSNSVNPVLTDSDKKAANLCKEVIMASVVIRWATKTDFLKIDDYNKWRKATIELVSFSALLVAFEIKHLRKGKQFLLLKQ